MSKLSSASMEFSECVHHILQRLLLLHVSNERSIISVQLSFLALQPVPSFVTQNVWMIFADENLVILRLRYFESLRRETASIS